MNTVRQPDVLIVADDVTGALDSSVAFAARGMRVIAALSPEKLPQAFERGPDVVAVSTNSRELPEALAARAVARLFPTVKNFRGVLFKKVDSRLKGHIAAEVDALGLPPERPMVVCPAIPRLGRLVMGGAVTGAGVNTPIPVAPRIGRSATVLDARDRTDLDASLPADLHGPVFVGAAGLAEALAARLVPTTAPQPPQAPSAPALIAIGSRDPVTMAQIAALTGTPQIAAPNGCVPQAEIDATALVTITAGARVVPENEAGEAFAAGIAGLVMRTKPCTLISCGGETTKAILDRLGIGLLAVRGELVPGVPHSTALEGRYPVEIVTKSGGFGQPDTLAKLVRLLN